MFDIKLECAVTSKVALAFKPGKGFFFPTHVCMHRSPMDSSHTRRGTVASSCLQAITGIAKSQDTA